MTDGPVLRRLSAILAADVAGYSRLIAADEVGILSRFRKIRAEVIDPAVTRFGGRLVGHAGDSLLVEFTNALAAVECAVACQRDLGRVNEAEPEDRRIVFRMGVNLGDVIAADGTIHGDGVNVAARLEKLSEPGGLCIAKNVFDQVETKLDIGFTDLGDHEVKNIAKPIRVFRAEIGGPQSPTPTSAAKGGEPVSAEKVSIAVLPFDNMSGDPEQGYFSDGITEDIITELSKFREFLVIARNSSFQFRGKANDVGEVAKKLGVQYVVEGSVRKIGNRVRVTVQLIDASSAAHVWAERYDRELDDIFAIQDEITQMISARLARQTRTAIASRARTRPTDNMSAYDFYLRALQLNGVYDTMLRSEPFLRRAIELDPGFAAAHALLSVVESVKSYWDENRGHLEAGLDRAKIALELDPEDSSAHLAAGFALLYLRRFREAGASLDRAVALNPNDPSIPGIHALFLCYTSRRDEALRALDDAQRRDPFAVGWFADARGIVLTTAGRYREAIASFGQVGKLQSWTLIYLAVCHAELGEMTEAKAVVDTLKAGYDIPGLSTDQILGLGDVFEDPAVFERFRTILRRLEAEG